MILSAQQLDAIESRLSKTIARKPEGMNARELRDLRLLLDDSKSRWHKLQFVASYLNGMNRLDAKDISLLQREIEQVGGYPQIKAGQR